MRIIRLFLLAALLAVSPAFAQTAPEGSDEAEPKPEEQTCDDVDWVEVGQIDEKKGFFDSSAFECEADWVEAETRFAPLLKNVGEASFRPLVYPKDDDKMRTRSLHIRKIVKYDLGGYRMFRMDCRFASKKPVPLPWDLEPIGGVSILDYQNFYIKPSHLRRTLKLSAADCRFFADFMENSSLFMIEQRPAIDRNGAIILHAPSYLYELIDSDGDHTIYLREGHLTYVADDESDAAESELGRMLSYFEERTKETGRR